MSTDDIVNIKRDNITTVARGAEGYTDLKNFFYFIYYA